MQNYRFEKAARNRKHLAIILAILFHLGLMAFIAMNQSDNLSQKVKSWVGSKEQTEVPIP